MNGSNTNKPHTIETIIHAALTVTRPTTAPTERTNAGAFLENWSESLDSFEDYIHLLQLFCSEKYAQLEQNVGSTDALSVKLLIGTMFYQKCRCDFTRLLGVSDASTNLGVTTSLMNATAASLAYESKNDQDFQKPSLFVTQLCASTAAIAVQRGEISVKELVTSCAVIVIQNTAASSTMSRGVALQILTMLPAEVQESTNLRFQEKDHLTKVVLTQGVWVSHVIPSILISLSTAGGVAFALKLLG